jgi:SHS2 domain-containing protein
MADPPYEELPHTADLRLRVRGETREALFAHAAEGVFALMRWQPAPDAQPWEQTVRLVAPDAETLLVDWLAELTYLSEAHGAHLTAFEVQRATETELAATARGAIGGYPERVIKAVTYHGLRVAQCADGRWEATITFDV